jgi:chromosome segregation ATPase
MDEGALQRARDHVAEAREGRAVQRLDAALERARTEIASLTAAAIELERDLPARVADAVHEGLKREVSVMARNLAEIRGLLNNTVRRLERIEEDVLAERQARIDDLALLVDLIATGWRSIDVRLEHLEMPAVRAGLIRPFTAEPAATDARNVA